MYQVECADSWRGSRRLWVIYSPPRPLCVPLLAQSHLCRSENRKKYVELNDLYALVSNPAADARV